MNPIVIIDDDKDEHLILETCIEKSKVGRPSLFFSTAKEFTEYLNSGAVPFLVICDVNMPGVSGMDIRTQLMNNADHRYNTMPFVFWSTTVDDRQVKAAFNLSIHGFFEKPSDLDGICSLIRKMVAYWETSYHPKSWM